MASDRAWSASHLAVDLDHRPCESPAGEPLGTPTGRPDDLPAVRAETQCLTLAKDVPIRQVRVPSGSAWPERAAGRNREQSVRCAVAPPTRCCPGSDIGGKRNDPKLADDAGAANDPVVFVEQSRHPPACAEISRHCRRSAVSWVDLRGRDRPRSTQGRGCRPRCGPAAVRVARGRDGPQCRGGA